MWFCAPRAVGWLQSFNATDRKDVEVYLKTKGCEFEWTDDDRLEFWFGAPLLKTYRGEELWFNQLSESNADYWLHHPQFEGLGCDEVQGDTTYGDTGAAFPRAVKGLVRGAIWETTALVRLEATDLLLLDNNIMQHGRMPYGGTRDHLVAVFNWPDAETDFDQH